VSKSVGKSECRGGVLALDAKLESGRKLRALGEKKISSTRPVMLVSGSKAIREGLTLALPVSDSWILS
jgi:hypothetical protein